MSDETKTPATPAPRDDIVADDGTKLSDAPVTDGTVKTEAGQPIDAPANAPGGQFDTNAGNADSGFGEDGPATITGTTPVGTTADDQPNVRPLGDDGNPLEVPDDDPRLQTNPDQPEVQVPATDQPDEAVLAGTGDSTDTNEG